MYNKKFQDDFYFDELKGLSFELKEKLKKAKPISIGHAMRIPGITPAALSLIAIRLKNERNQ